MKVTPNHWPRLLALALFAAAAPACIQSQQPQPLSPKLQSALGRWQVIDGDGKPGGRVEIYIQNGLLFGRITEMHPGRKLDSVCDKCSGEFKNRPILGMVFMRNFHAEGDDWVGGTVVDPENGWEYHGKIWSVTPNLLRMRGFIGISLLGRTETWPRIP